MYLRTHHPPVRDAEDRAIAESLFHGFLDQGVRFRV